MPKFFGGIFGRAEKPISTLPSAILIDGEEFDKEYVKYCIEQDRTVSNLEARLHECDDPKEIAEGALKAACLFYGGDWAGILDVDLDLDVWTPLWWYNASTRDMTTALFGEFELAKYMPNWIEALKTGDVPPIDTFDTAAWAAITPLSEISIMNGGQPVEIPDFTRGMWTHRTDKNHGFYALDK